jgi:hypothetical protein
MPVEHQHTIKAGTTEQVLLFYAAALDGSAGGMRGLRHDTPGASGGYIRAGASSAVRVPLVAGRLGAWAPGALAEVERELMPGVYQLGAPDEMLAEGSTRAVLSLRFPGASITPIEISLVAYDPQDSERIGVSGLANHKRHEFLRQALPKFTEMELALGEQREKALREKLASRKDP